MEIGEEASPLPTGVQEICKPQDVVERTLTVGRKRAPFLMSYVNSSISVDFSGLQLLLGLKELLVSFNSWRFCSFSDSVPPPSTDSLLPTGN